MGTKQRETKIIITDGQKVIKLPKTFDPAPKKEDTFETLEQYAKRKFLSQGVGSVTERKKQEKKKKAKQATVPKISKPAKKRKSMAASAKAKKSVRGKKQSEKFAVQRKSKKKDVTTPAKTEIVFYK